MGISSALGSQALLPAGLGFRNVLINGDFSIWQRGTSAAMATGSGTGYLADRWTAARASYAAGGTVSRQSASLEGFRFCSRVQRNSGNTSTAITWYFQTIETANSIPLAGKPVVYSFYIRAGSNFSGSIKALLYSGTATDQVNFPDGGITGSATVIDSTLSLTTSWQRVILYGRVGSTATQLFAGFEWTPSGTAGTNDFFEITGVQLEANSQPTPFEQLPFGLELALCQRYYEKSYAQATAPGTATDTGFLMPMTGGQQAGTSGIHDSYFSFRVEKRSTCTMVIYDLAGNANKCRRTTVGVANYDNQSVQDVLGYHNGAYFRSSSGSASTNTVSCHFTASAEL